MDSTFLDLHSLLFRTAPYLTAISLLLQIYIWKYSDKGNGK